MLARGAGLMGRALYNTEVQVPRHAVHSTAPSVHTTVLKPFREASRGPQHVDKHYGGFVTLYTTIDEALAFKYMNTGSVIDYTVEARPAHHVRRWREVKEKSYVQIVASKPKAAATAGGQLTKEDKMVSKALGRGARLDQHRKLQGMMLVADAAQRAEAVSAAAAQGLSLKAYRQTVGEGPLKTTPEPTKAAGVSAGGSTTAAPPKETSFDEEWAELMATDPALAAIVKELQQRT